MNKMRFWPAYLALLLAVFFWAVSGLSAHADYRDNGGTKVEPGVGMNCVPNPNNVAFSWTCLPSANGYDIGAPMSPVLATSSHAASTSAGGLQTVSWFRSTLQPSGVISHITLGSKQGFVGTFTVYIFDTLPSASTCTDNAAFVLAAADALKLAMAPVALTPVVSQGTTVSSTDLALPRSIKNQDVPVTQNAYICIVNGATAYTPSTTSDLFVKLSGPQD